MPRGEFATYRTGTSAAAAAAAAPQPSAGRSPASKRAGNTQRDPQFENGLRILLVEEDAVTAEKLRALVHATFRDRSTCDWVSDRNQAEEILAEDRHDVCLCSEGPSIDAVAIIGAAIGAGCTAPILVLAQGQNTDSDLKAIEAGAVDYIPKGELAPAALERSIRHALVRQQRIVRAHREIEGLTTEKTRLNLLRDANHRFVENACHDFRSPLTVVKEFASIISEGLAGDVNEEQSEFLGIILTRVDQLSQMVDGILDASRLESDLIGVKREEHSVDSLIEKVRPTLEQRAAAHKVQIEFALPSLLPNVFADAESVGRVIVNLGANACKYAGESGKIKVWARYDEANREVTIGVTDSGPGIAPEHVKLIFDRFQQVPSEKQEKDGFGLGLHIASELVRVNFGTLTVESEPNKGSTFAFTLPIFDVTSLIPLHFNFLKTSRHSFRDVAINLASVAAGSDDAGLADVERLLNRQLRSYDLLLRLSAGNWLVCIACNEDEISQVTDRILGAYTQNNRNRPDGPLPDVRFRPVGTWALANRPEGLPDAIRGIDALSAAGREAH